MRTAKFETKSPIRTFVTYKIQNEPYMLAAYTCTPLVKVPVSELKAGAHIKGTTIAELGNRNRPLDMIVYQKDGKDYLFMTNSSRGVMKIPTEDAGNAAGNHDAGEDKQGYRLRDDRQPQGCGADGSARRSSCRLAHQGSQWSDESPDNRIAVIAAAVFCGHVLASRGDSPHRGNRPAGSDRASGRSTKAEPEPNTPRFKLENPAWPNRLSPSWRWSDSIPHLERAQRSTRQ